MFLIKSDPMYKIPTHIQEKAGIQKKPGRLVHATLTVIVSRGKPPAPIMVRCFKDGNHLLDISSPASFNHQFIDLLEGDYDIYITGFNQKGGGDTTCFLSEEDIKLDEISKIPIKSEEPAYLLSFHFSVG
jgi:hypothetical protein